MDKELIDFYLLIKKYELYKEFKEIIFTCIYNNALQTFSSKQKVCIHCPFKKYNSNSTCQKMVQGNPLRSLLKMFPSLIFEEGKDSL